MTRQDVFLTRSAGVCAGGVALALYISTLAPSVGFVDSGELTVAAWGLGVPHPPGFPLYVLLTHFIAMIPVGSIAARVNFASALFAAAATVTVFVLALLLIDRTRRSPSRTDQFSARTGRKGAGAPARLVEAEPRWLAVSGALTAALLFASLRTTWAYAIVAEVYTLGVWLVVLVWVLMLRGSDGHKRSAAFIFGLAMGVHPVIALAMLPPLAVLVARDEGLEFFFTRRFVAVFLVALAGAGIYLYLPLAALQSPVLNWGDPRTPGRFWAHVSGWEYRGTVEITFAAIGGALRRLGHVLAQQFSGAHPPLALVLTAVGAGFAARRHRTVFWVLTVWIAANLLLTTWMNAGWSSDSSRETVSTGDLDAYYLPTFIACSIFAGLGTVTLFEYAHRRPHRSRALNVAIASIVAVAVLQPVVTNWRVNNRREDFVARNYVADVLRSIGSGGMLLLRDWQLSSPLMYVLAAERERPDIVALNLNLLERRWYLEAVAREHPALFTAAKNELSAFLHLVAAWENNPTAIQRDSVRRLALNQAFEDLVLSTVGSHRQQRPVYVTREVAMALDGKGYTLAKQLSATYRLVPQGLLFELRSDAQFQPPEPMTLSVGPMLDLALRLGPDHLVSQRIAPAYRDMLVNRGLYLESHGRCAQADAAFVQALLIDPQSSAAKAARARCQGRKTADTDTATRDGKTEGPRR